jgi:PncC family amidohydrolase
LRGGVVAYASSVKFEVLGVRPGPVICEQAAREMAAGVANLMGADVGIATTGVGGPDEMEGQPVGTVWIGVYIGGLAEGTYHRFRGGLEQICTAAAVAALDEAAAALRVVLRSARQRA